MACETLILTNPVNTGCESVKMDFAAEAYHIPWTKVTAKTLDLVAATCSLLSFTAGAVNKVYMRGQKPYEGTGTTGEEKPYGVSFTQNFSVTVYGNTPASASIVNKLSHGKHLFMLEVEGGAANSRYMLLGAESGIHASAPALEPYGDAGGWVVPMQSMNNVSSAIFITDAQAALIIADANA